MGEDSVQFRCFDDAIALVREIVATAKSLCEKLLEDKDLPVNYAAIFTHSNDEYRTLEQLFQQNGEVVEETPTGRVYLVPTFSTVAGALRLVKVRIPDGSRPERGDADFTVQDFARFKRETSHRKEIRLISRESYEMIELRSSGAPVRAYFSNPTLEQQYFGGEESIDAP